LHECKEELQDFAATRLEMLRGEMKDKLANLKLALPALALGAILLLAAFFLFTWGLVSLIAMAMIGKPYAYTVAFFVVFALYAMAGGATAAYGLKTLSSQGLTPERTLRVLKQDQIWLQSEARTQL
jgi:fatty acid desaturase